MTLSPHYVIPKKPIQYSMRELDPLSSNRKEMIDIYYNSFKMSHQKNYAIETVYSIENSELTTNFLTIRSQLCLSSQPSGLSSNFNYGFIEVSDLQQAELIAKSGVGIRRQASYNSIYLGEELNGVFLNLFGDITCRDKPVPSSSHCIVICRLALNQTCVQWVLPVSDKNEQPPRFLRDRDFGANAYTMGRHLAVYSLFHDSEWAESFETGLIYLWDHDAQSRSRLSPRHCLPIAVLTFVYHEGDFLTNSLLPHTPQQTNLGGNTITLNFAQHSLNSLPDSKEDPVHKSEANSSSNLLLQTDNLPFDMILNKPQSSDQTSRNKPSLSSTPPSRLKIVASLWMRFRDSTLMASQLWTGLLYNGNHKLCPIKLRTYYPPSFSLNFSEVLSIDLATNFDLFYKDFPEGLFSEAYPMLRDPGMPSPIVIRKNSIHYVEVCPNGRAAIPILNALISHLQEHAEVAYAYIDEVTCIYFMPTSPLTHHLKLTHPSHPNILHALIYRFFPSVLSSTGVCTSPSMLDTTRIVQPIPTLITSRTSGDKYTHNESFSTSPYPYILQRVPLTTTRTIGTQCSSSPCHQCMCKVSSFVDASSQTYSNKRDQVFEA